MKIQLITPLFLSFVLLSSAYASNATEPEAGRPPSESAANKTTEGDPEQLPGIALSQGISEITGVAISPLIGISAIGAWRYYHTPNESRADLKWYCSPYFWGTALVLIAFIQLKTFLPKPLSLPLDVADTWEDKISALLVSGTLVPDLVGQVATNFATPAQMAHIMESPFSSGGYITLAAMTFDYRLLFLPLGIAAFFVVWMTSHAINLLILLCPFSIVDLGLKIFKGALIGAVIVSYLIHPILGVIVSLSFIAMATYLAPKVFRFSFFVTLLSFDLMTPWRGKKASKPDNAHAFISHKSLGAPKHTYGRIKKTTDGSVTFTYRPRLILKTQTIILPDKTLVMRKGLLYPDMLQASDDTTKFKSVIIFPPRYRKSEHLVAEQLEINDVRDHSIAKGIAGIKAWFRDFFSRGKPDQEAAVMIER